MLAKQLFYLTSDQLHAWQWQRNTLFGPHIFPATRAGLNDFLAYLDRHGNRPGYLLTDLIEEDYTRLLLPHVRGRAGRKLRERRLVQHYRDTPYRAALVQGRSDEGRRDDEVLFTALTNPLLLTPWVDAMELMQTPLAGIYSCAMLGRDVLHRLAMRHRHVLLASWHTAGLRQTYFLRGAVKFSRLVQATPEEAQLHAVATQTARTQQFLGSVRLLARGDVLHVLVLAAPDQVERLAAECTNTAETIYHIVPLDTAATALHVGGAAQGVAAHVAEPTLLAMLARNPPASHYPTGAAGNYYRLLQARLSLYASSAVLATAGVVWSILNLASYTLAHGSAEGFRSETAHYRANYDRSMSSMPPAADKTANMRAAVSIDRTVARQGPWPVAMMRMVSGALEQSPQVRISRLDWRADVPGAPRGPIVGGAGGASGTAGTPALAAPTSSLALGIPKSPPQKLRVEAEVLSARNDYRKVLGEMNVFAQRLASIPNVTVEIVQLPFDIRPTQKLSGTVGAPAAGQEQNKFTLDLTWTP
ncbi:hypothetical protein OU994_15905 [Pseudoduganella sp. SL102]|uniref:hypothetical protein n=1 Tax=Pseudoduganella sp. SL102 TaxID=2995154 RepID=UPI00248B1F8D|nr:hypothetical protein [Pseudoduganella sp. SL102]WBR99813.1 hypothetical protein OU994_15905 [Pseudoduganella sp. SL102]